jgi:hypothetical protein
VQTIPGLLKPRARLVHSRHAAITGDRPLAFLIVTTTREADRDTRVQVSSRMSALGGLCCKTRPFCADGVCQF